MTIIEGNKSFMYKNSEWLKRILLSASILIATNLPVHADSLSLSDFSPEMQDVLKDNTSYGEGAAQKYFEFQYDANNNIVMVEVSSPSIGAYTITYNYDDISNPHFRNYQNLNPVELIEGNFINLHSEEQYDAGALFNHESVIGTINGNFIGKLCFGRRKRL